MHIYYTNDVIPYDTVVVLGEFDGLHIAHMSLIEQAKSFAKKQGLAFGIMCFAEKLGGKTGKGVSGRLIEPDERINMLSECDFIYIQSFNDEFMNMTPLQFCSFLKEKLSAAVVFAGFNYRFGKGAKGDVNVLKSFDGFGAYIAEEYKLNDKTVSSTAVRRYISDGNIEEANKMLGRYYRLSGTVEKGKQNGRKLGFPTANIRYNPEMTLPKSGVYAGYTYIAGIKYKSIINIGNNPTFNAERITVESYIFDFNKNIYGEIADVEFVSYIREDKRFNSINELISQIEKDKNKADEILDG